MAVRRSRPVLPTVSPRLAATVAGKRVAYAGYPAVVLYDRVGKGRKPLKQLLWGDWLSVLEGPDAAGMLKVRARGADGYLHESEVMPGRLLEVIFVDIGQGDGCLLVTPDDRHVVIDAGEGDNMARFLRWRYGRFRSPFTFEAAILTHGDLDHYGGLRDLLAEKNVRFRALYTNGLVDRVATKEAEALGEVKSEGDARYVDALVPDLAALRAFVADDALVGRKVYPGMLRKALAQNKIDDYHALGVRDGHVPGFGAQDAVRLQVLGPVVETFAGRPGLRWLGTVGRTKNGHSVVLRLVYGKVSMLLGGDLNVESEGLLLQHHARARKLPLTEDERQKLALRARKALGADIAKACHHGSADFSRAFLRAVNPLATVISSGDDESYAHPRADALGAIGRHSRGVRPLVFSTELARSAPERIKHPSVLMARIDELLQAAKAARSEADEAMLRTKAAALRGELDRSVAVYGAINVRTDGERVVIAQKLESTRTKSREWDLYRLERDASGELAYVSGHEDGSADDA